MKTELILSLLLCGLGVAQTQAETSFDAGIRWICSTEKSRWQELAATNATEAALKELFSPKDVNFTLGRVPIGANNFLLGWYSLNETPGDCEMKHFSIERNREALIPFIKAAMNHAGYELLGNLLHEQIGQTLN